VIVMPERGLSIVPGMSKPAGFIANDSKSGS
jgi:hypothetical protein